jgi:P27 family predicted phage terminase small subunit
MPEKPDWLTSPRALQLWHTYGPVLNQLGLLESLDAVGFSMLCAGIDAYLQAAAELAEQELVVLVGEMQCAQQNPLVAIVRSQAKAVRELLVEFGMTPTGRVRLTGSTSVQPVDMQAVDPLEELAKRMNGAPIAKPVAQTTPAKRPRTKKTASKSRRR